MTFFLSFAWRRWRHISPELSMECPDRLINQPPPPGHPPDLHRAPDPAEVSLIKKEIGVSPGLPGEGVTDEEESGISRTPGAYPDHHLPGRPPGGVDDLHLIDRSVQPPNDKPGSFREFHLSDFDPLPRRWGREAQRARA